MKCDKIKVHTLASGQSLEINIFRLQGSRPGPKVYIQSGIHGAELQGHAVIYLLMERLLQHSDLSGEWILVPYANPIGGTYKSADHTLGRLDPAQGENWNRAYLDLSQEKLIDYQGLQQKWQGHSRDQIIPEFKKILNDVLAQQKNHLKGAASRLCFQLQSLAQDADIVLDLHTAPHGSRYLYSAHYQVSDAAYFLFPHIISIPHQFYGALDESIFAPWCRLSDLLGFENPIRAYTLELGSEESLDWEAAHDDLNKLFNFFAHRGLFSTDVIHPQDVMKADLSDCVRYYAPCGGSYSYPLLPGKRFQTGDVLAESLSFSAIDSEADLINARQKLLAKNDGALLYTSRACACNEGHHLLTVLENLCPVLPE